MAISKKYLKIEKAYTLIELLVSMAIFGFVMVIFSQVLFSSLKIAGDNLSRANFRESITEVFDLIKRDVRNADVIRDCDNASCTFSLVKTFRWTKCDDSICKYERVFDANGNFLREDLLKKTDTKFFVKSLDFDVLSTASSQPNATYKDTTIIITIQALPLINEDQRSIAQQGGDGSQDLAFDVRQIIVSTRNLFSSTASGGSNVPVVPTTPPATTPTPTPSPTPVPNLRGYQRNISISQATTLADIQVKVVLNQTNFDYSKARADGADIRFTTTGGVNLPYWTEVWNNLGSSVFWVKVPISTSNFLLKYGKSTDTVSQSDGAATFIYYNDLSSVTFQGPNTGAPPNAVNHDIGNQRIEIRAYGNLTYMNGVTKYITIPNIVHSNIAFDYKWDATLTPGTGYTSTEVWIAMSQGDANVDSNIFGHNFQFPTTNFVIAGINVNGHKFGMYGAVQNRYTLSNGKADYSPNNLVAFRVFNNGIQEQKITSTTFNQSGTFNRIYFIIGNRSLNSTSAVVRMYIDDLRIRRISSLIDFDTTVGVEVSQ